ncbi:ferritin, middle subunit-like [Brachionichthys hirsutus]|uniref:ferritin, middle subunit-like n=1 Tax=Brachionichthys hirsutus TaxID=412623 RepID=UPI003605374F
MKIFILLLVLLQQTPAKMESEVRQNYHLDCEALVNRMIDMELFAFYTYTSMALYFSRDDVALPGFSCFFKQSSEEERENANKLLSFQNKRGGRMFLQNIKKPEHDEWGSGLEAMQNALQLEKNVNQALLDLHKLASEHQDPHLCDFLETHYLNEQVEAIKKLGDYISNLSRMDAHKNKMAEYLFDKHSLCVSNCASCQSLSAICSV